MATSWFWWWPFGRVAEVSAVQLNKMRLDKTVRPQIIDVRTGVEWRNGHIPGAVHVPVNELGNRVKELYLDGSRPIIAICRSAHRSIPAVRVLHHNGFRNACQLEGGMLAWWKADLPLEVEGESGGAS
jgi:rhodanese-related sulfurtransferase